MLINVNEVEDENSVIAQCKCNLGMYTFLAEAICLIDVLWHFKNLLMWPSSVKDLRPPPPPNPSSKYKLFRKVSFIKYVYSFFFFSNCSPSFFSLGITVFFINTFMKSFLYLKIFRFQTIKKILII